MKLFYAAAALAAMFVCAECAAEDLTAAKAEELLKPYMTNTCGTYYTEQDEPDFADLADKPMCTYVPRVTHIKMSGDGASVDYNHDRHFGDAMAIAWLKDYDKMAAHEQPSLMFRVLKEHLDKWRSQSAGVDNADRFGSATFKLDAGGWHVVSAPQE